MATHKSTGWVGSIALLLSWAIPSAPAQAVTDADRLSVYKDFRAQFDAKQYAAAKPLAEKLVQLTEQQYGPDELQLSTPLTNLGTVNYKLGDYRTAIENYQRSLRILQAKSTMADKLQIRPLHGLGVSFMGANDPESAVVALKRAADLSRNTEGLFNINQIEFIDPLIDAYSATGRFQEAEKEAGYALRVEEATYGRNSIKLINRLDKLARWYEDGHRYTTERTLYERSLSILQKAAAPNDLRRVGPLRGIARSYLMEQFYGEEGGDSGATFNNGINGAPVYGDTGAQRRGETTLTTALAVIDANTPPDLRARGLVLADLGDWFLVTNGPRRAYDSYAESWKALQQVNETKYLEVPRILAYHPSISSVDRSQLDPSQAVVKTVELHFRVDREGRVDNITSPTTDVPEGVVRNSMAAMRRARYAPRIENGAPAVSDNVVFYERVLIKDSSQQTSAPSATTSEKAAAKPAPEPKSESAPSPQAAPPSETTPQETKPEQPAPEQKPGS